MSVFFLSSCSRATALAGTARRKLAGGVACLFIATAALCVMAAPVRTAERETRVLILNGTDPNLPAFRAFDAAMRDRLATSTTGPFQFFSETLDAHRLAFSGFEQEFLALLRKKYSGVKFDIVIPVTGPAFEFVNRNRDELWPNAWVLFHSIPDQVLQGAPSRERTAGVITRRTMGKTADLARRLQPHAPRILVVGGVSELDKDYANEVRSALADLPASTEVEYSLGLPLPELLALVARERADTIVLFFSYFRDREGRPHVPRDVLRAISAVSPAPIYGTSDTFFGEGIAAGVVESYVNRGQLVADRLMQLAAGDSIPVRSVVPDLCAADARALRKFSLDEARLPEGCEVRFAERSLWREYRFQILGTIALVLLQAALIAWLLFERQRRWRATEQAGKATAESGQHRESLAHLVRVHTVGEMSSAIAHEVNQPLAAIKNYAFAARLRLSGRAADPTKVEELLDKIEEQASRAGDVLHSLRAMMKKHKSERTRVDVGPLVAETLKLVEMEGQIGGIRVEPTIAPDLPSIFVDGIQIQQVVLNLTRNAIEAMEEAGQVGAIAVDARANGHGEIAVSVADHGPGVAPGDAERIFEPFYSTKGGGLGVGLSICRAIVEAHGGHLSLAPNPGGGSVFRFTLPAMQAGSE